MYVSSPWSFERWVDCTFLGYVTLKSHIKPHIVSQALLYTTVLNSQACFYINKLTEHLSNVKCLLMVIYMDLHFSAGSEAQYWIDTTFSFPSIRYSVWGCLLDGVKYCFRLWFGIAPYFVFTDCDVMTYMAQAMGIHFHNYYIVQSSLDPMCVHFLNMRADLIKGFIKIGCRNSFQFLTSFILDKAHHLF